MKNGKNAGIIIVIAILLLTVTFMDTAIVFRMAAKQTKESGIYQLQLISSALENTINEAENLTMKLAITAQSLTSDRTALTDFIYEQKEALEKEQAGAYNVFVAGPGWDIIPDLVRPEGFVATERSWYTGAFKHQGQTYVTPPYVDALTGDICYTVSVLLGDKETVLGVDYTMENIQAHIEQMHETGSSNAVIVTSEGIIAGFADAACLGKPLITTLPDYASIYSLAKNKSGVVTRRIKADLLYENLFATRSGSGWYLIVSESDWVLYKESYAQMLLTVFLSLALFSIIIILYLLATRNQKRAEAAYSAKEAFLQHITAEFQEPLHRILDGSAKGTAGNIEDYNEEFSRIHNAGEKLSEMLNQIISYSNIVRTENKNKTRGKKERTSGMNRRFRLLILLFMTFVMLVSFYTNQSATYRWGNQLMQSKAERYEFQLSEWVNTQKSILDMFCSIIATHPEMLDDYEGTVDYLNRITLRYPEISVTYMTNPNLEHTVYMNNGWQPTPDWHVEERQWYIDTLASDSGWSMSAPYYDEQTGGYCVTISERVYDYRTGEFLGNFGIDFFMDKLVDILGDSYTDTGYAFLVDTDGDIINHPYGSYQMSVGQKQNISELPYAGVKPNGKSTIVIKDYDGTRRILIALRNADSKFAIYVVSGVWKIYGKMLIYGLICLLTFLSCIAMVWQLLTGLIRWQDQTTRQMQAAADSAIAAGKAKSQFLAQMSHEIRTPINAVLGMNEMILRESKDNDILEYSSNIQTAGKTLLTLINSILDFSKIEDGKMEIIPVKYETTALITGLVNSISERAKAKNLELKLNIDETLPVALFGDDVRLSQVIVNLLTNAVKYTEKGCVTLTIRDNGRKDTDIDLYVEVRDTGIGIKQEDLGRLFESFERLDEERNRTIEGTGLGMSIVTKLLSMMGSELQVESEYGKGSCFSFTLRQQITDSQPLGNYYERRAKTARLEADGTNIHAPKAKVLVVDDNDMNLKVAKNLMKLCGIVPDMAASGAEAIEKVRAKNYHIIFLDHMMPKMDGLETLRHIREENLLPEHTAVIALTANAVVGAKESYLQAGFDDYLSKPIEIQKLAATLAQYLPADILTGVPEASPSAAADDDVLEFAPAGEADSTESGILEFAPEPEGTDESRGSLTDSALASLSEAGIDTTAGLGYCGGDRSFYAEMLHDYRNSFDEKSTELAGYFDSGDWSNYQILIHALKSTSKTIGATETSELAKALEQAAKNADTHYIAQNHESFLKAYRQTTESIAAAGSN